MDIYQKLALVSLIFLLFFSPVYASQYIPLQGSVADTGTAVANGDLHVFIYSAASGGTLIYDSLADFNQSIISGYFNVMLGSGTVSLDLNYGTYYYMDMQIDGTDIDFNGLERKKFESSHGTVQNLIPDSTLDTNSTDNSSWLGKQHTFTADNNFSRLKSDKYYGAWLGDRIGTSYLNSSVMIEGENVSLLTNDSGYLTNFTKSNCDSNASCTLLSSTLSGSISPSLYTLANCDNNSSCSLSASTLSGSISPSLYTLANCDNNSSCTLLGSAFTGTAPSTLYSSCDNNSSCTITGDISGASGLNRTYTMHNLLLPQEVWNNSINTMKGSFQANILDWKEKVSETVFNSASTEFISTTKLANGNFVIAYSDAGAYNGYFVIYDPNGNLQKGETAFNTSGNTYTTFSGVVPLTNGNFVIAYPDGGNSSYGTFVIFDSNGNNVKGETVFNAGSTSYASISPLTNGNFVIAYRDQGNSNYGTFVIYNKEGTQVVGETVFNSANTAYTSITPLVNGNFVIAYEDLGNSNYGTFVIYNKDGTQVVGETVFNSGTTTYTSASTLVSGNIAIAYRDSDNYGRFVVYSQDGNNVLGETQFNGAVTSYISTSILPNNNIVISYKDEGNSNYGTFCIYDANGAQVKGETVFNSAEIYYTSTTTLTNGNFAIAYMDFANSGYGTFITYESSGLKISGDINSSQSVYVDGNIQIGTGTIVLDGTKNRVGVGTKKAEYNLDVRGDVNAEQYCISGDCITSWSEAVPAGGGTLSVYTSNILTPQTIWNNSTIALKGGHRMEINDWELKVAETIFNDGLTRFDFKAVPLKNGNFAIVYTDQGNSDYGTFVIVDSNGNIKKSETIFNSGSTSFYSGATSLPNGNFVVKYNDGGNSNYGTFVIYDSNGNQIIGETVFNEASSWYESMSSLVNGNFVIAYTDQGNSNYGTFVIYDSNGNQVAGETVFNSGTFYSSTTSLANGNFVIAYTDQGNSSYGTFVIYSQDGNLVVGETVFNSADSENIQTTTLANGTFVIAYCDRGNSDYGTFVIYSQDGNLVVGETTFSNSFGYNISYNYSIESTSLANGNFVIAYRDQGNSNYGTFVIYDSEGNLVKGETVFNTTGVYWLSLITLTNGNFAINYTSNSKGRFQIWQGSGTKFLEDINVVGQIYVQGLNSGTGTQLSIASNQVIIETSSKRWKTDIKEIDTDDIILRLTPVNFIWAENSGTPGAKDIGLIAEDVYEIAPEFVTLDNEGKPYAVKYKKIQVVLLKKIQEQEKKIQLLEEKILWNKETGQENNLDNRKQENNQILEQQEKELQEIKNILCSKYPEYYSDCPNLSEQDSGETGKETPETNLENTETGNSNNNTGDNTETDNNAEEDTSQEDNTSSGEQDNANNDSEDNTNQDSQDSQETEGGEAE